MLLENLIRPMQANAAPSGVLPAAPKNSKEGSSGGGWMSGKGKLVSSWAKSKLSAFQETIMTADKKGGGGSAEPQGLAQGLAPGEGLEHQDLEHQLLSTVKKEHSASLRQQQALVKGLQVPSPTKVSKETPMML